MTILLVNGEPRGVNGLNHLFVWLIQLSDMKVQMNEALTNSPLNRPKPAILSILLIDGDPQESMG